MNAGFRWMVSASMLAAVVALVAVPMAEGHHSAAMFDDKKVLEMRGVIRQLQWKSPHVWLQVVVQNAGVQTEWSLETTSPNTLSRRGWRPSMFKPGEGITVRVNPMKDGSPAGFLVGLKLADGTTLGRWD